MDKALALEEINKLSSFIQNIELMHTETCSLQEILITETDQLNKEIENKFDKFRKKPVKIKKLSQADKAMVHQCLM